MSRQVLIIILAMALGLLAIASASEASWTNPASVSVRSATATAPASSCIPPPSGIVAWWPLDDNGNDLVGIDQASLFGNPAFAAGKVGQGLSFDGNDDNARVAASKAIDVGAGDGLSFDAWINPSDLVARPVIEWNDSAGI